MPNNDAKEKLLLHNEEAVSKAKPFGRFDDKGEFDDQKVPADDPYAKDVAPSLLNAGDIRKYVLATGLISPFYEGGGKKSRMKDASYEGRIGGKAYVFDSGEDKPKQIFFEGDRVLTVPENSIVFVESDLYFRVPDFIALRFNLQIRHVHRGLLLGTGPLIDPGYWGKLCIPLHNLTDEPYDIPVEEGLIWIEFTKATAITERIGRPPLGKEFPEILPFLRKASSLYARRSEKVGIRSSIQGVITASAERAEAAKSEAEKARKWVAGIGTAGGIAAAIGLCGILFASISVVRSFHSDVDSLKNELENHLKLSDGAGGQVEAQPTISRISEIAESLTADLEQERSGRRQMEETIEKLLQSDRSNTARFDSLLEHCLSIEDGEKPEFCAIVAD